MKMIYVSSAHQATNTADRDSASSLYHGFQHRWRPSGGRRESVCARPLQHRCRLSPERRESVRSPGAVAGGHTGRPLRHRPRRPFLRVGTGRRPSGTQSQAGRGTRAARPSLPGAAESQLAWPVRPGPSVRSISTLPLRSSECCRRSRQCRRASRSGRVIDWTSYAGSRCADDDASWSSARRRRTSARCCRLRSRPPPPPPPRRAARQGL